MLLGLPAAALSAAVLFAQAPRLSGPMPARDGETCVVCQGRCTPEDLAYLVDGQRFALMRAMESDFLRDPSRHVAPYRPATMQFHADGARSASPAAFVIGLCVLLALLLAALYVHRALGAARGMRKIPLTSEPVACPACGQPNHPAAALCLHCGRRLHPEARSEAASALGSRRP